MDLNKKQVMVFLIIAISFSVIVSAVSLNDNKTKPIINDIVVVENSGDAGISILAGTASSSALWFGDSGNSGIGRIRYDHSTDSMRFLTNDAERIRIDSSGNVGIATTTPNQKLMVAGNANITGTLYVGALQYNSPILDRTAEPFVAKCTIADDGKLIVEYIHNEVGNYNRVIEAVNHDSNSWWHRSCFEKNERFKYLDSLNNNSVTIDDIGFDWSSKTAFVK